MHTAVKVSLVVATSFPLSASWHLNTTGKGREGSQHARRPAGRGGNQRRGSGRTGGGDERERMQQLRIGQGLHASRFRRS